MCLERERERERQRERDRETETETEIFLCEHWKSEGWERVRERKLCSVNTGTGAREEVGGGERERKREKLFSMNTELVRKRWG